MELAVATVESTTALCVLVGRLSAEVFLAKQLKLGRCRGGRQAAKIQIFNSRQQPLMKLHLPPVKLMDVHLGVTKGGHKD